MSGCVVPFVREEGISQAKLEGGGQLQEALAIFRRLLLAIAVAAHHSTMRSGAGTHLAIKIPHKHNQRFNASHGLKQYFSVEVGGMAY
jgi:hypothetical protein